LKIKKLNVKKCNVLQGIVKNNYKRQSKRLYP